MEAECDEESLTDGGFEAVGVLMLVGNIFGSGGLGGGGLGGRGLGGGDLREGEFRKGRCGRNTTSERE
jgi:hypothetical protein